MYDMLATHSTKGMHVVASAFNIIDRYEFVTETLLVMSVWLSIQYKGVKILHDTHLAAGSVRQVAAVAGRQRARTCGY